MHTGTLDLMPGIQTSSHVYGITSNFSVLGSEEDTQVCVNNLFIMSTLACHSSFLLNRCVPPGLIQSYLRHVEFPLFFPEHASTCPYFVAP